MSPYCVVVVPKQFLVPEIIERRPPLAATARRAGWVGCNILIGAVPASGRIPLLRDGRRTPKAEVLDQWRSTLFLRDEPLKARGWLIEVMKCVELIWEIRRQVHYSPITSFGGSFRIAVTLREMNGS